MFGLWSGNKVVPSVETKPGIELQSYCGFIRKQRIIMPRLPRLDPLKSFPSPCIFCCALLSFGRSGSFQISIPRFLRVRCILVRLSGTSKSASIFLLCSLGGHLIVGLCHLINGNQDVTVEVRQKT